VIDTHAHLEACADPPHEVVERARRAGVARILAVGSTIETCRTALAATEANDGVYAILGVHPHEAASEGDRLGELRELLVHPRAVAVGETGLDFYRDRSPRDRQLEVFEAELDLARGLGKPVVVHTRAADVETTRALERFDGTVVLHCFSSAELLPVALERGYYVSFAGNVTYPNASELRLAATQVPADRLLAETDSPYLAPQPVRGRPNEPANVVHTLAQLAASRGEDPAELEAQIDANATAAFALP
jgi:TatD DNase family protein